MRPSYKTNDPKGWCGDPHRGAAMGRSSIREVDSSAPVKLVLQKVRLDSGGYDINGTYFGGGGDSVYWFANDEGTVDGTLRAASRSAAKKQVREEYSEARFYN